MAQKNNAHAAAVARYNAKKYKTFSVNLKKEEYDELTLISGRCGIGKSRFLIDLFNNLTDEQKEELVKRYGEKNVADNVE